MAIDNYSQSHQLTSGASETLGKAVMFELTPVAKLSTNPDNAVSIELPIGVDITISKITTTAARATNPYYSKNAFIYNFLLVLIKHFYSMMK